MTIYDIRYTIYGKRGVALLLTLIVMISLISVVGAYLGFVQCSTSSTGGQIIDTQAFYLADAGIQYGIFYLKQNPSWTGTTSSLSLGEGEFLVTVSSLGAGDYRLTATGTAYGQSRRLRQDVTLISQRPEAFDYVIFFGGGDGGIWTTINRDVIINGDIFINGDMDIGRDSTVNGDVIATGAIELGRDATITGEILPDSAAPAVQPALDTSYYDNEIAAASTYPSGDQDISGEISGTTYVNGYVNINGNLSGTGTIVATGDIDIAQNKTVADGITLISGGTFTVKKNVTIGTACLLYACEQLTFGQGGTIGTSDNGSVLLSNGDIDLQTNTLIYGLVFGNAEVNTVQGISLTGNLSGAEIGNLGRNSTLTLDTDLVDFGSFAGFGSAAAEITAKTDSWREI